MVIQQKSGNIPVCSPLQLLSSRLLHLFLTEKFIPQTFFRPPIFSPLYVFQVPLFYTSPPDDPLIRALVLFLFSLYSYQPLKLNFLTRIHFPFFSFPSFFQKSGCSSPLMQDLLFPYVCSHINCFFLTKYFSYLFECTYLSES